MARVNVTSPTGELVSVEESDLQHALGAGFTQDTPEDASRRNLDEKYGNRPIAAGALSAAREFTFGASDPILARTGLVSKETIEGLEHAPSNETANLVGQGAGFLGGLFATGPLKLSGKAGQLAGRAIIGGAEDTLLRAAARSAIEGGVATSLYSLSRAVSESAMDGSAPLNAEKILAHAAEGLTTGAGMGAIIGAATHGIARPIQGLFRRAPPAGEVAGEVAPVRGPNGPAGEAEDMSNLFAEPVAPAETGRPVDARLLGGVAQGFKKLSEGIDYVLGGAVKRYAPELNQGLEAVGPESGPEEWLWRALDIKKGAVQKVYEKGLYGPAAEELLKDPRLGTSAKTIQDAQKLIEEKLAMAGNDIDRGNKFFHSKSTDRDLFDGDKLANWIDDFANQKSKSTTLNDPLVRRLRSEAERIRQTLGKPSLGVDPLEAARTYKNELDDYIWENRRVLSEKPMIQAMRDVRKQLNSQINEFAEGVSTRAGAPEEYKRWSDAMQKYGMNKELLGIVKDREFADLANNKFGLTSFLGALGGGGMLGPVGAAGGLLAREWFRRRGPFIYARALYDAQKNAAARAAARGFHSEIAAALGEEAQAGINATLPPEAQSTLENAIKQGAPLPEPGSGLPPPPPSGPPPVSFLPPSPESQFGRYRDVLQSAADLGPGHLFAAHATLWKLDPDYRDVMQKSGLVGDDSPDEEARASDRARGIDDVQTHLGGMDKAVRNELEAFVTKKGAPGTREKRPTVEETISELNDLAQLAANPEAMAQRIDPGERLARVAPSTSSQLGAAAVRAIQYLHSIAPAKPVGSVLPGQNPDWKPSRVEIERYQRAARAVKNPMSVLEDVRKGRITQDAATAFRTVYPNLAAEIAQGYLEVIGMNRVKLGYQQLLSLSVLLDAPLAPSLQPDAVSAHQAVFKTARPPPPPPKPVGGPKSGSSDLLSMSQRLESGGQQ